MADDIAKKRAALNIGALYQQTGPVQGPSLSSIWKEHLASLPQKTEDNLRHQQEVMDKAYAGDPEAIKEFSNMVSGVGGVIKPTNLKELIDLIRQQGGTSAARRLEQAADLVPNLEHQYQPQALKEVFGQGNNSGVVVMNPNKFENYAAPLSDSQRLSTQGYKIDEPSVNSGYTNVPWVGFDEKIKSLQQHVNPEKGTGFSSVPFLQLANEDKKPLPEILGHEGRHRSEALSQLGIPSTIVQIRPVGDLKSQVWGDSNQEFLDNINKLVGNPALVRPETFISPDDVWGVIRRNSIKLPEMFANGGSVQHMAEGRQPIGKIYKETGPVQGPSLSSIFSKHMATLPEQIETNQRAMDKTMSGIYKTDPLGKPNPNYYPEAIQEFTQNYMPNLMGITIGPNAKFWNKEAAKKFLELEKLGHPVENTWPATGTFRDIDNNVKQKISDAQAKFMFEFNNLKKDPKNFYHREQEGQLGGMFSHADLVDNYPDMMSKIRMAVRKNEDWAPDRGVNNLKFNGNENIKAFAKTPEEARSIALHELQHSVQGREGWNRGSQAGWTPKDFAKYQQNIGEQEARRAEAERNLTYEQLLQQHPITGEPLNKINYAPSEGVAPIPIQLNNPLVESAAQDALTQQAKMKAQFAMHGMAEQERARRIAENTPSSPVSDSLLPPNR